MREILFRGKRVDNGEWHYGGFYQYEPNHQNRNFIVDLAWFTPNEKWKNQNWQVKGMEVIPETVGQFTGLTDKNEVKIFEGDIVTDGSCNAKIFYNSIYAQFMADFSPIEDSPQEIDQLLMWAKVIGNIHDNPELLQP